MRTCTIAVLMWVGLAGLVWPEAVHGAAEEEFVEIPADRLEDKIRGGLIGQVLGNLNGIPHEFKYLDEPGDVREYVPGLPEGARSDDDTDIEWVYLVEMERGGEILIPDRRMGELWKKHINRKIWCANAYARVLMDLGLEPPLTGRIALNPWAGFNISGQFICESFGLIAPGMPRTAARTGLHYTHAAIDGEPAQATQLFTAMIATAFFEQDMNRILDAGLAATDPGCEIRRVVLDVRRWHQENPGDWRGVRRRLRDAYTRHGGQVRDHNGYELNTGAVIAALLYGQGDFPETLRTAFNFGWDADCNAATAGAIVGVICGREKMDARGWKIRDVYLNATRDAMPQDETLTRFGDRLAAVARIVIRREGGEEIHRNGRRVYRIHLQRPINVEPLPRPLDRRGELRTELRPGIRRDLSGDAVARARAAYLALCLGEAEALRKERPEEWTAAVKALSGFPDVVRQIFRAPVPMAIDLQRAAGAEGLAPRK